MAKLESRTMCKVFIEKLLYEKFRWIYIRGFVSKTERLIIA
jgi:hypothetical protein